MPELLFENAVVLRHQIIDCAAFRDVIGVPDHKMLDVISLQKISCGSVADAAEHFAKLRDGKNIGIGFEKFLVLFAFHGIQSFQIVISTADESTVYDVFMKIVFFV